MVEYIQQALKQAAHEATVLLYSRGVDPFSDDLARGDDLMFCFEKIQAGLVYIRHLIHEVGAIKLGGGRI